MRDLSDQITVVASLAPRQIDRGDVKWPYWENTEAGKYRSCPVGRKRHVIALFLNSSIVQLCNTCQIHKKFIISFTYREIEVSLVRTGVCSTYNFSLAIHLR